MNRVRCAQIWALTAGQLASLLVFAACVWWVYRDLSHVIGGGGLTGSITWGDDIFAAQRARLLLFAFAALTLHALLGLLAYWLARLSRAAFPGLPSERLSSLTILWVTVLFGLVLAANASWYPASLFATEDSWLRTGRDGIAPLTVLAAGVGLVLLVIAVLALRRVAWSPQFWMSGAFAIALLAAAGLGVRLTGAQDTPTPPGDKPHIVILGIDSLRNDLSEAAAGESLTPRIDAFLADSTRFTDTMSPLARTYPAWLSILTGRHPVTTNARFNLMPRELVHEGDTLADALDAIGYRSTFATDEVRFANFDRSYGFDRLITPPIGASDFVVPTVGDIPLVNIVANTRLGRWFFPNIHANRAAAVTYEPGTFVERLEGELEVDGPSFIAIHLTLAHWPYTWAGHARPSNPQEYRPAYRMALREVDRQFEDVLTVLGRKGVLDNAIVVVLSDHGEALGYPSDSIVRKTSTSLEVWDSLWGHGTSVLSPHQYGVVFAMRAFGAARLPGESGLRDWPVTLEDVRPTLQELATGAAPGAVDGISLVPYLALREPVSALAARVRFTETCLYTAKMLQGKITVSGLVSEAGIYYELLPETGWVQLRPDRLAEIMAKKQRAAVSRDALLARVPSWNDDSVTWLYTDRRSPAPRRLEGRPDPSVDPEAARLWRALEERFPGELSGIFSDPRM
jgi:hypothetical protein